MNGWFGLVRYGIIDNNNIIIIVDVFPKASKLFFFGDCREITWRAFGFLPIRNLQHRSLTLPCLPCLTYLLTI